MATIYGTYSCGHEGKVYFPGSTKTVEWRAAREFERVCPECQAIENEKEVSALREKYGAADADLPMLNLSLIHISEPTRQAEISYAVFCLKKKKIITRKK